MHKLFLEQYALRITTFEETDHGKKPTITHIFWGASVDEAVGNATSHLKTDKFFYSSFKGKMNWKGGQIILSNEYELLSEHNFNSEDELLGIIDYLKTKTINY